MQWWGFCPVATWMAKLLSPLLRAENATATPQQQKWSNCNNMADSDSGDADTHTPATTESPCSPAATTVSPTSPTVIRDRLLLLSQQHKAVFRIHVFLGLPYLDPDPLVRGMDPDLALDPDPDPSIIKQI